MSLAEARSVRWAGIFLGRLTEHRLTEQATIIAFNIIYSLFPLALSLAAIGGYVYRGGEARAGLLHAVNAAFPAQVAREMAQVINTAGNNSGLLGTIGFLSLFWTGSNLFTAMETSLARIFAARSRGIVYQRLVAFLMIPEFSALLILSAAASNGALALGCSSEDTRKMIPPAIAVTAPSRARDRQVFTDAVFSGPAMGNCRGRL